VAFVTKIILSKSLGEFSLFNFWQINRIGREKHKSPPEHEWRAQKDSLGREKDENADDHGIAHTTVRSGND
jgi:hypothetical protein